MLSNAAIASTRVVGSTDNVTTYQVNLTPPSVPVAATVGATGTFSLDGLAVQAPLP